MTTESNNTEKKETKTLTKELDSKAKKDQDKKVKRALLKLYSIRKEILSLEYKDDKDLKEKLAQIEKSLTSLDKTISSATKINFPDAKKEEFYELIG
ncbi:hypothetical protein HX049_17070 [Myroides odoratimimus]|uniref:hypothetical protein n=1 Tax=Myroides odoratimimus TaxID=76832 RepID=UPI0025790141|nr:hypothetical protein [Myroides odoratimimus]MDM1398856.1 hypothetical protein [Myroides odoratimimus]